MTDISPEDSELINRYLANRLTDREISVVETRIVAEPAFRNEVELTEAMRDGLRQLHDRGEIAPLLSQRPAIWQHPRFALAATLAAVAIGAASFLLFQRFDGGQPELAVASLRFEHTRAAGAAPDAVWRATGVPTRLQMQFDVGLEPAAAYQVAIERLTDGVAVPVLASTASLTVDGLATLDVDGARLPPGDYEITLRPQPPATTAQTFIYALRITGQD